MASHRELDKAWDEAMANDDYRHKKKNHPGVYMSLKEYIEQERLKLDVPIPSENPFMIEVRHAQMYIGEDDIQESINILCEDLSDELGFEISWEDAQKLAAGAIPASIKNPDI
jgi:hypothetical protein|tara:strand:- start:77 stop:415 length:339 start_codon:yes stop_codon:yes gene_type:complete